jgi:hypothetical protein
MIVTYNHHSTYDTTLTGSPTFKKNGEIDAAHKVQPETYLWGVLCSVEKGTMP